MAKWHQHQHNSACCVCLSFCGIDSKSLSNLTDVEEEWCFYLQSFIPRQLTVTQWTGELVYWMRIGETRVQMPLCHGAPWVLWQVCASPSNTGWYDILYDAMYLFLRHSTTTIHICDSHYVLGNAWETRIAHLGKSCSLVKELLLCWHKLPFPASPMRERVQPQTWRANFGLDGPSQEGSFLCSHVSYCWRTIERFDPYMSEGNPQTRQKQ